MILLNVESCLEKYYTLHSIELQANFVTNSEEIFYLERRKRIFRKQASFLGFHSWVICLKIVFMIKLY